MQNKQKHVNTSGAFMHAHDSALTRHLSHNTCRVSQDYRVCSWQNENGTLHVLPWQTKGLCYACYAVPCHAVPHKNCHFIIIVIDVNPPGVQTGAMLQRSTEARNEMAHRKRGATLLAADRMTTNRMQFLAQQSAESSHSCVPHPNATNISEGQACGCAT